MTTALIVVAACGAGACSKDHRTEVDKFFNTDKALVELGKDLQAAHVAEVAFVNSAGDPAKSSAAAAVAERAWGTVDSLYLDPATANPKAVRAFATASQAAEAWLRLFRGEGATPFETTGIGHGSYVTTIDAQTKEAAANAAYERAVLEMEHEACTLHLNPCGAD